jgi:hypothetical protein
MSNPSQGGSYRRNPDGSLERVEATAQLGSPDHEGVGVPVEQADAAPAAEVEVKPRSSRAKE